MDFTQINQIKEDIIHDLNLRAFSCPSNQTLLARLDNIIIQLSNKTRPDTVLSMLSTEICAQSDLDNEAFNKFENVEYSEQALYLAAINEMIFRIGHIEGLIFNNVSRAIILKSENNKQDDSPLSKALIITKKIETDFRKSLISCFGILSIGGAFSPICASGLVVNIMASVSGVTALISTLLCCYISCENTYKNQLIEYIRAFHHASKIQSEAIVIKLPSYEEIQAQIAAANREDDLCGVCITEKEEKLDNYIKINEKPLRFSGPYHNSCIQSWNKAQLEGNKKLSDPLSNSRNVVTTPKGKHFQLFSLESRKVANEIETETQIEGVDSTFPLLEEKYNDISL